MTIITCTAWPYDFLEKYRPKDRSLDWQLVVSGFWSEDSYHSGHIAYYLTRTKDGLWIMDSVQRNALLDGITQEDVEAGCLNDDQLQAIHGIGLKNAQKWRFKCIVAVCTKASPKASATKVARTMYKLVSQHAEVTIDEPDEEEGLIAL
jgi:hypothetical protein